MIREELLKTWTNLKPKFNQLVQWKQSFPNETAHQVKVRINTLQSSYNTANEQLNMLRNQNTSLQTNYNQISSQLTTTRTELEKERSWWDKWFAEEFFVSNSTGQFYQGIKRNLSLLGIDRMLWYVIELDNYVGGYLRGGLHESGGLNRTGITTGIEQSRKIFKAIYMYYRDQ